MRQCPTAGIESPTSRAIAVFEAPTAEASTMRARRTRPCGALRDRTRSLRLARSVPVSSISCLRGRPMLLLLLPESACLRAVHSARYFWDTTLAASRRDPEIGIVRVGVPEAEAASNTLVLYLNEQWDEEAVETLTRGTRGMPEPGDRPAGRPAVPRGCVRRRRSRRAGSRAGASCASACAVAGDLKTSAAAGPPRWRCLRKDDRQCGG